MTKSRKKSSIYSKNRKVVEKKKKSSKSKCVEEKKSSRKEKVLGKKKTSRKEKVVGKDSSRKKKHHVDGRHGDYFPGENGKRIKMISLNDESESILITSTMTGLTMEKECF